MKRRTILQFGMTLCILIVLCFQPVMQAAAADEPPPPYKLTIIHTNDVHSYYAPDSNSGGGASRQSGIVKQIRAEAKNSLLVDAGDRFMGGLFFKLFLGSDSSQIMNTMRYDVMTLGNHEFDMGNETLAAFLKGVKFPVVNANVDFSQSKDLNGKIKPYTILKVGGEQIGVTGVLTPETTIMSSPGKELVFSDDLAGTVQKAVDEMTAAGVNKIVLLSHIGYQVDQELAGKLKDVDVIVGGHSHTLLSNTYLGAVDKYPFVSKSASGDPLLIVQTGAYLKYVGRLNVEFDEKGILKKWSGDTIQISHYVTPEMGVESLVQRLNRPIEKVRTQKIGETSVALDGSRESCRFMECNMGNLITDAVRAKTKAQVMLMNGGGIRTSIDKGAVSMGQVMEVLPFGNLISTFKISGADLLAALENGVSRVDAEEGTGRFTQVSGLKYSFDASKEVGSRIVSVEVYNDQTQKFEPLDPKATYSAASIDFIRTGGDDYKVLAEKAIDPYDFGDPIDQVVADYITANSPVEAKVDGRITQVKP